MSKPLASKDPENIEPYFAIWCDIDTGLNDGSTLDHGELQGATISDVTWTLPEFDPPELIKVSSNQNAVTIAGVSYAENTVCTIIVSGGVENKEYRLKCKIVTSDGRTLNKSLVIPVKEN